MAKIRISGVQSVKITGEFIRLDQFLKFAGIADTGGMAKAMIADGEVSVNGETATERGKKLRDGTIVRCAGKTYVITVK